MSRNDPVVGQPQLVKRGFWARHKYATAGTVGGALAGAGIGVAAGIPFGPPGMIIGGAVGGVIGAGGGYYIGEKVDRIVLEKENEKLRKIVADMTAAAGRGISDAPVSIINRELEEARKKVEEYVCPISQRVMTDPVVTADGETYERADITRWFATRRAARLPLTSPAMGDTPLPNDTLVPNSKLRREIDEFRRRFPAVVREQDGSDDDTEPHPPAIGGPAGPGR